jgi:hypothetical protein
LENVGYDIGLRVLELLSHREKANRKEINLISMLQFVTTTVWRALFGKIADGLEKAPEETECTGICFVFCSMVHSPIMFKILCFHVQITLLRSNQ